MNRKSFLRNCLMAAAISICPKSLLPSMGVVEQEVGYQTMEEAAANYKRQNKFSVVLWELKDGKYYHRGELF